MQAVCRPLLLAIPVLIACAGLRAQQLPIKTYTTSDGLPRNGINRIVRDSHGFLWFCTVEGLSRFDGYTFTNYAVEQGLPDRMVTDLIETRDGEYWIATFNGLARFNPNGVPANAARDKKADKRRIEPRFVHYLPNWLPYARNVLALLEGRDGTIWCITNAGMGHLRKVGGQWQLPAVDPGAPVPDVTELLQDKDGALWIGTYDHELYRRWPDGRLERYTGRNGLPDAPGEHSILALLQDRNGRLWVGTNSGLFLLVPKPDPQQPVVALAVTTKQGLPHNWIDALLQSSDGEIWIGTRNGPAKLSPDSNGKDWKLTAYPAVRVGIGALVEDRGGNLWMGTEFHGAMKLARNGFTTYGVQEGLGEPGSSTIFEDQAGRLCVINKPHGKLTLNRFDGTRFESVPFKLPAWITDLGWGWNQIAFQDRAGEWWLATGGSSCERPTASWAVPLGCPLFARKGVRLAGVLSG
jgi:ligand-binding sensor domain-containing protein